MENYFDLAKHGQGFGFKKSRVRGLLLTKELLQ